MANKHNQDDWMEGENPWADGPTGGSSKRAHLQEDNSFWPTIDEFEDDKLWMKDKPKSSWMIFPPTKVDAPTIKTEPPEEGNGLRHRHVLAVPMPTINSYANRFKESSQGSSAIPIKSTHSGFWKEDVPLDGLAALKLHERHYDDISRPAIEVQDADLLIDGMEPQGPNHDAQRISDFKFPSSGTLKAQSDRRLDERDKSAIAYAAMELNHGDTMVFITFPEGTRYDAHGLKVPKKPFYSVNSENLRATGSKIFEKLLDKQNDLSTIRLRKRKGYQNGLPLGYRYIIDLTPPDEGDDAVDLLSELSCTPGICNWYSASKRCDVSRGMCYGKDDIMLATDLPYVEINKKPETTNEIDETLSNPDESFIPVSMEAQEYCPIRHRAGIEKLLQIIEKKPGIVIDSAPKMWTIFVLGKYFDCTSVVVDYIVTWILAEPNCKFIEILPEVSLKIGLGLKTHSITRAAFGILVSEEALRIASGQSGKDAASSKTTRFLRAREDLDEDTKNSIEHAGQGFFDRIHSKYLFLMNGWEEMLAYSSEDYRALQLIEKQLQASKATTLPEDYYRLSLALDTLKLSIRDYLRACVLSCLAASLSPDQILFAQKHRDAEKYLPRDETVFHCIYDTLGEDERLMTGFFWENLMKLNYAHVNKGTHSYAPPHMDVDIKHEFFKKWDIHSASPEHAIVAHSQLYDTLAGVFAWGRTQRPYHFWDESMTLFSLDSLMDDLFMSGVKALVTPILQRGPDFDFISLTDTILCITDDEWKYLPLWAGGLDDGTGGVFEDMIPPPMMETAPSGPGPSFTTGYSAASNTSSAIGGDYDRGSVIGSSINTSVRVENGYGDHRDRRIIYTDEASDSDAFTDAVFADDLHDDGMYNGPTPSKDLKGKSVIGRVPPSIIGSEMDSFDGSEVDYDSDADTEKEYEDARKMAPGNNLPDLNSAIPHRLAVISDHDTVQQHCPEPKDNQSLATEMPDDPEWDESDEEEAFDFGDGPDAEII